MKIIDVILAMPILERIAELDEIPISFGLEYDQLYRTAKQVNNEFTNEQNAQVKVFGIEDNDGNWSVDPAKEEDYQEAIKNYLHTSIVPPAIKLPPDSLDGIIKLSLSEIRSISWIFDTFPE